MDEEEKKHVLDEWHNAKIWGVVVGRLLRSVARWLVGGIITWEVMKTWWKS